MGGSNQPGLRILLVDDNRTILLAMGYLLQSLGHSVTPARGIEEAISVARRGPIDLMISDINLGDGDGLDLIDRVRGMADFPTIAMSGQADLRESSLARGFTAFMPKPISHQALQQTINRVSRAMAPASA